MRLRKAFVLLAVLSAASLGVWTLHAHDGEHHSPGGNGQPGDAPLSAQGLTPCVGGMAGTFPCNKVDLAALLPVADIDGTDAAGITANDIWGWTDPQTEKEYALLGLSNGVAFVDVTAPSSPVYLGNLPRRSADSLWRSVKVYRDHLYVVSEAVDHGMQVFDLTRLRGVTTPQTFTETAFYNNVGRAHTIAINEETGFAYIAGSRPGPGRTPGVDTCSDRVQDASGRVTGRGLHVVDVRNPAAPAFAGCVDDDGYVHEAQCVVYRGPDGQHNGREICFNANEDTLTIVDVTNKAAPAQLSRTTYAGVGYTHQGWLTGDQTRFLINDELDEQHQQLPRNRTYVMNVSDLDSPFLQTTFQGSTPSIDHNLYIRGLFAFESNYRSGVRVIDVRGVNTNAMSEVAFFDVFPADDQALFNGTWANYPFFASGTVIASGMEQGLFVLRPQVNLPKYIDYEPFFVRQHYRDFFSREPDNPGQAFWTGVIDSCMGDDQCREVRRINVSGAFFLSIEFQQTGFLVQRLYKSAYGDATGTSTLNGTAHTLAVPIVRLEEFLPDTQRIGRDVVVNQGAWQAQLEANKVAFTQEFVQRSRFVAAFPLTMLGHEFVDRLIQRSGAVLNANERQLLISEYASAQGSTAARASVLRQVAEHPSVEQAEKNRAFVLMQYFGYLRRNPNEGRDTDYTGYDFWLGNLEKFNGNFVQAELVKAFITSTEYRQRFNQ